ncbi:hypothetical protein Y919_04920 [Caloranaerobacter azorensis H53214]|uniref:Tagatose-6-phosphate kinase n=1 Tax=Caloranaerobacter azorensis H53214 TaxID=1156417 RepID=A0A096BIG3_9FIRM|nr:1-phosphofructokinase [Caloranaerobacter azorensis]KGG80652.1 hypothetical protein Y919_04920 [Caloranaerobacter azorensis H53214]
MIITVTLNPAVDKTIYIRDFMAGEVNKVEYSVVDPGGKGINVSKTVAEFDCDTIALGFLGGENGEYIRQALKDLGIKEKFTEVSKNTRTNIKIVDLKTGDTTDINETGGEVNPEELKEFINIFKRVIKEGDIVVLSGSVPKGIDNNIYRFLTEYGNKTGCKVILDVSSQLLKEGIKGKPYMIKPNLRELEELLNVNLDTKEKIVDACTSIIKEGVELVCVSMGSEGALLIAEDFVLHGKVPKVEVKSTVGAGDSLVAGFAAGLSKGLTIEKAFKQGIAASIVSVTKEGTKAPTYKEVQNVIDEVEVSMLFTSNYYV